MLSTSSHCRINFKLRYFYSKGAYLVLVWSTLVHVTTWSLVREYPVLFRGIKNVGPYSGMAMIPAIPFIALAPLLGWLADSKLGNYKVFKLGCFTILVRTVLSCLCVLILENTNNHTLSLVLSGAVVPIMYAIGLSGAVACIITALQLGLDQMPDASAANITSYIAWFVCSIFASFWIYECLYFIPYYCAPAAELVHAQLVSLVPAFCMAIVCCSIFVLAPKWLRVEPESPKALKTIYRVLKFAAKHKAPLNRSAFTYWEEDIPSRLDLGKSKYGGPFTTEQVEDVKTFLGILVIHIPIFLVSVTLSSTQKLNMTENLHNCANGLKYTLVYSPWWSVVATTIIYEFVLYPLIRNKVPTTLKRVGIVSFMIFLVNLGFLVSNIISHFVNSVDISSSHWPHIIYYILFGVNSTFIINGVLEFVCAQSPYNMRGLLTGNMILMSLISTFCGEIVFWLFYLLCNKEYSFIAQNSFSTAVSLVGFILYCLLARWYKRRVRDEDYSTQRGVEEVYDRYLSHVH